mgnify:CR=1 FL=1
MNATRAAWDKRVTALVLSSYRYDPPSCPALHVTPKFLTSSDQHPTPAGQEKVHRVLSPKLSVFSTTQVHFGMSRRRYVPLLGILIMTFDMLI